MGLNLLLFVLLCRYITSVCSVQISDALLKTLDEEIDAQCLLDEEIDLQRAVKSLELCIKNTKYSMDKDKVKGRDKIQAFRINMCSKSFYQHCLLPNKNVLVKCLPSASKTRLHFDHLMNAISSGLEYTCEKDGEKLKNMNFTSCVKDEYQRVFKGCDKRNKVLKMAQNWTSFPFDDENCLALLDFAKCAIADYEECPDESISKFVLEVSKNILQNTPCKHLAAKLNAANTATFNLLLTTLLVFTFTSIS